MRTWVVDHCRPIDEAPLQQRDQPEPTPGPGQVLVRISCCGVCRTDLHLAEGDLEPRRSGVVPGHEVVGRVEAAGPGTSRFEVGDRVGVGWLGGTDGSCRQCRRGHENLCIAPTFTGWDLDGGYAEACLVDERYAYRLPANVSDEQAAPLLCAGIIGYRALHCSGVAPGGRLGIYGFGGSAHLTLQLAVRLGMRVHVFTRSEGNRKLATSLGADSASSLDDPSPEPLEGAILFAPAGDLVPVAMRALDSGGTLAIAGIWLSPVPTLDYTQDLFGERKIQSVTANTRTDGENLLALADRFDLRATTVSYPFDQALTALQDLAHGRFSGAAVLHL